MTYYIFMDGKYIKLPEGADIQLWSSTAPVYKSTSKEVREYFRSTKK